MWPYVLLVVFPLVIPEKKICWVVKDKLYSTKRLSMKLFWLLLFLLLVLRHDSVGRDLSTYRIIFQYIVQSNWNMAVWRSSEIGFNLLNKLVSIFTNDFRWIIVISALLECFFISKAYVRYSDDTALTISLYIIMSNFILLFSGLRQAIAISLGFWAFEQVRKKRVIRFLAIVIVAMLFHTSAFMLLFMYPLYHVRFRRKSLLWVVPSLMMVFAFNEQIFEFLTRILELFTKYDGTIEYTGSYTVLVLFILFAIFSYVIPDESLMDIDTVGMRNFLLFSVGLQMFAPLHTIAMRMNYYYIAFIPLLIPRVIQYSSLRWKQLASAARYIMIAFFAVYFFVVVANANVLDTFPYHFLWETV